MRVALTSFVVLMGLMFSAAAIAGHDEAAAPADEGVEQAKKMPPVEASPPDEPIAAPTSPGTDTAVADDELDD